MQMRAARMHGYNEPLRLEEIPVPDIGPEDVLVRLLRQVCAAATVSSSRAISRKAPR